MITSNANPRIKNLINLKKSAKTRKEQDSFLVEGPRMFFEAPSDRVSEVYLTEAFRDKYADRLEAYHYELISEGVCQHVCDTKTPQGVVAVVRKKERSLGEILEEKGTKRFLILETLQDPGNVGTILRTAEAAGITAIIMNRETADPYQPKVIRATMGATFRQAFLVADDLAQIVEMLKQNGVAVYAAHLQGEPLYGTNLRGDCAFMIGNEGNGLSDELSGQADRKLKIPMKGQAESLNAAMAAGIVMYEMLRQESM